MDEQSLHTDTVHDWITGYLTNSLTPEEMQSFQEWLNASEENRKYFSDIQEVWIAASNEADDVHSFNKDRAYQLFLRRTGETTQQGINKRKAFQLRPWMYAAAMTIIVFICGTIASGRDAGLAQCRFEDELCARLRYQRTGTESYRRSLFRSNQE